MMVGVSLSLYLMLSEHLNPPQASLDFYRLDSLAAFFQYLFQFLHGSGSQHGDSRLTKIGNALEDRRGGKVATGVENASVLVDALHVDAKLLLQEVNLLIYG